MVDWGDVPAWTAATIAVVAAGTAWKASARSIAAANRSASADERAAYHLDSPKFTASIEDMGGWHRLVLRLDGPIDVRDRVGVTLKDESLAFRQNLDGVTPHAPHPVRDAWVPKRTSSTTPTVEPGGMTIGQDARWMIERTGEETPDRITILVDAQDGERSWQTLIDVEVPRTLQTDSLGIY